MDNIYIYLVPMPEGVREYVAPCSGGYTVYIDEKLDDQHRADAYRHALEHVRGSDFEVHDVQHIESRSHDATQK